MVLEMCPKKFGCDKRGKMGESCLRIQDNSQQIIQADHDMDLLKSAFLLKALTNFKRTKVSILSVSYRLSLKKDTKNNQLITEF